MEVQAKAEDFASADDATTAAAAATQGSSKSGAKGSTARNQRKGQTAYSSTDRPLPDPMGDTNVQSYIFDTKRDIGMTLNESSEKPGVWVVDAVTEGAQAAEMGLTVGVTLVKIGTKEPPKDPASLARVFKTLQKHRNLMQLQFSTGAGSGSLFRRRPSFTLYQYDV